MIRVHVFYPAAEDLRFDEDYYRSRHLTMLARHLGDELQGMHLERGLQGGAPDAPPVFGYSLFLDVRSRDGFLAAFGAHAEEILGDVPNYTNASPQLQITETIPAA